MFDDGTVVRLDRWRDDGGRQVPLITGPRGVGKSTAVGLFAKGYPEVVTLDLRNDPEHRRILSSSDSTATLLRNLRDSASRPLPDGTLFVLDEVQFVPEALGRLGDFGPDRGADVLATMSCAPGDSVDFDDDGLLRIRMSPVGFRGFLRTMDVDDETILSVTDSLASLRTPNRREDRLMNEMMCRYLVTGGMPGAVAEMSSTGSLRRILDISRGALRSVISDARSILPWSHDIVSACLRSLPRQLAVNGRFTYAKVDVRGAGRNGCAGAVSWLESSGLVSVCSRRSEDGERIGGCFKAYTDCGSLAALMDDWASDAMVNGRYWSCPCAVLENMAAKMLDIHGVEVGYYSTDRREADFLVPTSSGFTGVAVRSGSNDRRKSLASLTECGTIDRSVEFGGCRSKDADMYPLYAAGFPDVVFPDAIRRSGREYGLDLPEAPGHGLAPGSEHQRGRAPGVDDVQYPGVAEHEELVRHPDPAGHAAVQVGLGASRVPTDENDYLRSMGLVQDAHAGRRRPFHAIIIMWGPGPCLRGPVSSSGLCGLRSLNAEQMFSVTLFDRPFYLVLSPSFRR